MQYAGQKHTNLKIKLQKSNFQLIWNVTHFRIFWGPSSLFFFDREGPILSQGEKKRESDGKCTPQKENLFWVCAYGKAARRQ